MVIKMFHLSQAFAVSFISLYLISVGSVRAGDSTQKPRKPSISVGFSTWLNKCDVPAAGQDTGISPSFGPFFMLGYGKIRLGGTFYLGHFHVEPEDGIERTDSLSVRFRDEEADKRKFTSSGETERLDFNLNIGYEFNRYARLSFSLVINRHTANLTTLRFPEIVNGQIKLPSEKAVTVNYTDTQLWIGEYFQGSFPVQTVSTRFSVFYNLGLLVLASETGDGRLEWSAEKGEYIKLEPRPFGENIGAILSAGIGFQLFNDPSINVFAGYNAKSLAEHETFIVDHSHFHGPYFGVFYTIQ